MALSVDDEATTKATIEKHRLSFPVGHSADADEVAAAHRGLHQCDASLPADRLAFLLTPDGNVAERRLFKRADWQIGGRRRHRDGYLSQVQSLSAGCWSLRPTIESRTAIRRAAKGLAARVAGLTIR